VIHWLRFDFKNCFPGDEMGKAVIDFRGPVAILFFLACTATVLAQAPPPRPTITESGGKVHIVVQNSRPLTQVLTLLQNKYAWRINYEDPQYTSKLDYTQMKNDTSDRRIPNGGDFVIDFPAGATEGAPPDEQKTLQLIVDAYNRSNNPGRFEVRHNDAEHYYDVVGTSAHDSQGKISPQPVLLDASISFPSEDRIFPDTIDLLCQKISDKTHVKFTAGVYSMRLDYRHVTVGGKEQAARAYVSALIAASGRRLCWALLFDPESGGYYLNLTQIGNEPAKPPSPAPTSPPASDKPTTPPQK
jgi:hypothetical protein